MSHKKIAIVYDWMDKWGGVERVLVTLKEMLPEADFFTSYVDYETAPWAVKLRPKTSFIQQLPVFIRKNRLLSLFFYPYAFEAFDFSAYDLVISVTSSFAKGVITKPGTKHICYLLTPTRFLWVMPKIYQTGVARIMSASLLSSLKEWDYVAAQRPDEIIAISQTVARRTEKFYQRKAQVIYPPFDGEYWKNVGTGRDLSLHSKKYFLTVSRLEKYKRVDLVIETFNQLDLPLIIVGTGTEEKNLHALANKNIQFLKNITDEELAGLYQGAKALIMPQEEDFGYVSLEAQFFGCPLIAYAKGGALETVVENKTGIFFREQTVASLTDTIARFKTVSYNIKELVQKASPKQVETFDRKVFEQAFNKIITL